MKKILVSAYGCEPNRGSEAGVGWNWVLQMAQNNELYVITRRNDKNKIEANIPESISSNLHFVYYDTCELLKKVKNKEKGLYLYYWFWQIGIIPLIQKLCRENDFDYCMHLSFGSLWMPTFLPFFKIPFIWGPLGGGDGVPKAFLKTLPLKQRIIQTFRYVLINTSFINPLVVFPSKKAKLILCRTENNIMAIPKKYREKTKVILETAMETEVFLHKKNYISPVNENNNFIVTGRMVPFKNIKMAIEAFYRVTKILPNSKFTIIGKGPEQEKIEKYIKDKGIEDKVEILKQMERTQVFKKLEEADIYVFPSLREGGSWSLMEAMAVGLPVVCFEWTGMDIITDKKTAIRISPTNYENNVEDFKNAMLELALNYEKRYTMGIMARQRIKDEFLWDKKGEFFELYLKELEGK